MAESRRFRVLQPTGGLRLARALCSLVTVASLAVHMILGCCCQHAHCGGQEHPHRESAACVAHDAGDRHDCGEDHDAAPAKVPDHRPAHESQHCDAGGCVFLPASPPAVDAPVLGPAPFVLSGSLVDAGGNGGHSGLPIARGLSPPPGAVPLFLALQSLLI